MEYIQPILSSMVTTAGEQSAVLHLSNPIYLTQNFVSVVSESERFSQALNIPWLNIIPCHPTLLLWKVLALTSWHHRDPATRDFQSSISVEALLLGCHLDVEGLLQQQLLPPVRWPPPSGLGGGSPTHALLQLTPYFRPLRESVDMLVTDNLLPLLTHLP